MAARRSRRSARAPSRRWQRPHRCRSRRLDGLRCRCQRWLGQGRSGGQQQALCRSARCSRRPSARRCGRRTPTRAGRQSRLADRGRASVVQSGMCQPLGSPPAFSMACRVSVVELDARARRRRAAAAVRTERIAGGMMWMSARVRASQEARLTSVDAVGGRGHREPPVSRAASRCPRAGLSGTAPERAGKRQRRRAARAASTRVNLPFASCV